MKNGQLLPQLEKTGNRSIRIIFISLKRNTSKTKNKQKNTKITNKQHQQKKKTQNTKPTTDWTKLLLGVEPKTGKHWEGNCYFSCLLINVSKTNKNNYNKNPPCHVFALVFYCYCNKLPQIKGLNSNLFSYTF